MTAFALALVSGAAHATWNALAKFPGRERAATVTALLLCGVGAAGWWALHGGAWLQGAQWPWVGVAGLGEAAYVFSLGLAYAKGDLAITYTVSRASALVFIWPASWLAFGTVPSALALLATAVVCAGILLTARSSGGAPWHVGWTLATGLSVAAYHTGYKGAVTAGATQAVALVGAVALAVPLLLVAIGPQRAHVLPLVTRPRMLLAGVLCAASFLLMLAALAQTESGRILGVRNASVGFALLLAVLRGERLSARQWAGVGVLGAGVAMFAVA